MLHDVWLCIFAELSVYMVCFINVMTCVMCVHLRSYARLYGLRLINNRIAREYLLILCLCETCCGVCMPDSHGKQVNNLLCTFVPIRNTALWEVL